MPPTVEATAVAGPYQPLDEVAVIQLTVQAHKHATPPQQRAVEALLADLRYHRRMAAHMTRRASELAATLALAGGGSA